MLLQMKHHHSAHLEKKSTASEISWKIRRDFLFLLGHLFIAVGSLPFQYICRTTASQPRRLKPQTRPLRVSHDVLHPWAVNSVVTVKDTTPGATACCLCFATASFRISEREEDMGIKKDPH